MPGSLKGHGWAGWKFPRGMELPLPGYSLPAGFMMLFVFSWPATTLSSCTLWSGIEYQCKSCGVPRPILKNSGLNGQGISTRENTIAMLRSSRDAWLPKCVLKESNSTSCPVIQRRRWTIVSIFSTRIWIRSSSDAGGKRGCPMCRDIPLLECTAAMEFIDA